MFEELGMQLSFDIIIDAQKSCTDKLHRQAAQTSCTDKLHRQAAQTSCTDKLHRQAAHLFHIIVDMLCLSYPRRLGLQAIKK